MKRLFYIGLMVGMLLSPGLRAQTTVISGTVQDSLSGKALQNVHIQVKGSSMGTTSRQNGSFSLRVSLPATLEFTHLSYAKNIKLLNKKNDKLNIRMAPTAMELGVVSIHAKAVDMLKDKPLYVTDYLIENDHLLLLAFRNKKNKYPFLVLMNSMGDSISGYIPDKPDKLFEDIFQSNYILSEEKAWEIDGDNNILRLLYPMIRKEFDILMYPLVTANDSGIIFKKFYAKGQILQYAMYSPDSDEAWDIAYIGDKERLEMLKYEGRFQAGKKPDMHEQRFIDMFVYKPIYAPLVNLGDSLLIMDFTNGKMDYYTPSGVKLGSIKIDFHENKYWKPSVYYDRKGDKLYTRFERFGKTWLREIAKNTGQLGKKIDIPDLLFVEKIKVHDGMVYFLYKNNRDSDYKHLYQLRIQ